MKHVLWIGLFLFSAALLPAQTGENRETRQVLRCIEALHQALLQKDSASLVSLLEPDLTYGHSNGWMQSRDDLITTVMNGRQDYHRIDLLGHTIRFYGTTAVAEADIAVNLHLDGKPVELKLALLMVWVRRDHGWTLAARQSVKK